MNYKIREAIAKAFYALSKVYLAPPPLYTWCIGEWVTCGYKIDKNGFFFFPLNDLAAKVEKECHG